MTPGLKNDEKIKNGSTITIPDGPEIVTEDYLENGHSNTTSHKLRRIAIEELENTKIKDVCPRKQNSSAVPSKSNGLRELVSINETNSNADVENGPGFLGTEMTSRNKSRSTLSNNNPQVGGSDDHLTIAIIPQAFIVEESATVEAISVDPEAERRQLSDEIKRRYEAEQFKTLGNRVSESKNSVKRKQAYALALASLIIVIIVGVIVSIALNKKSSSDAQVRPVS